MIILIKSSLLVAALVAIAFSAWLYHYAKAPLNLTPEAQEIIIQPTGLQCFLNHFLVE